MSEPNAEAAAPQGENGDTTHESTDIQAIRQVKLPTFWHVQPALWFVQAEAQFHAFGVKSDSTKYFTVISSLDSVALQGVADFITSPLPATGKYELLKKCIIERFAESTEKQLRKVLTDIELGDKTPSHLLREMKLLAGNNISDSVLRTLWLQRLPSSVQMVLATADTLDTDKMAVTADKIAEVSNTLINPGISSLSAQMQAGACPTSSVVGASVSPTIASVTQATGIPPHSLTSTGVTSAVAALQQQVSELAKLVQQLSLGNQRSTPRRSYSRSRSRSRNRQDGVCYYHRRFANKALKCTKPCAYEQQPEN